ncbi:DUF2634 domain-containing protein [Clostridium aciditolerans]|uniref:DUF2634 domain-containing protein n=1 Tax=Clostridium aciditolerans TaxID=339861 RepID=A0A934HXB9_9CLOT|nr:DUF2634 domain-containing protein [Clostridium aciditolerans]MBI6873739.1 DUF2634 domain-containing protein [Clostridium aciditolerans]
MSIFPQVDVNINNEIKKNDEKIERIPKEYAWDFENNDFIMKDGKLVVVEGKDAIKIWIWKALHTVKLKYSVYSENYGHDLETLIGEGGFSGGLLQSEGKRLVWECLKLNPYIERIEKFDMNFSKDKLDISFIAITSYGEVKINV